MNLKEIIDIHELTPHVSVAGITREHVAPHDSLFIEGVPYRVAGLRRLADNTTAFVCSVRDIEPTEDDDFVPIEVR